MYIHTYTYINIHTEITSHKVLEEVQQGELCVVGDLGSQLRARRLRDLASALGFGVALKSLFEGLVGQHKGLCWATPPTWRYRGGY